MSKVPKSIGDLHIRWSILREVWLSAEQLAGFRLAVPPSEIRTFAASPNRCYRVSGGG
jgi:hypothetical protein